MSLPLLVVNVTPEAFLAGFQGAYDAERTYQHQQMVKVESNVWICLKTSLGNEPEEGSEYWGLLGNIEAVVTTAEVEEAQAEAETKAETDAAAKIAAGFTEHTAAFVDPTTGTLKETLEALIAAGVMASE